jgi:hypothetical protein
MEGADTVAAVVMVAEDTLDSLVVVTLVDSLAYIAAVSVAVV